MSIEIGRYISYALGRDNASELHKAISGRLSPVRLPENADTEVPWICYASAGIDEEDTKDGLLGEVNTVTLDIACRTYEDLLLVLHLVREAMRKAAPGWNRLDAAPFLVDEQRFRAGPEEYDEVLQAYCRTLNYVITTYDNGNSKRTQCTPMD